MSVRLVIAVSLTILLGVAVWPSQMAPAARAESTLSAAAHGAAESEPVGRFIHRLTTRTENTLRRLSHLFGVAGLAWASLAASALVFSVVAVVSSVADRRMFALRRNGPGAISRYLANGTRTFFRILRDRGTPNSARALLLGALVYWLVPRDLVPDTTIVPGFVDDLLIAVGGAKAFIYLCPDTLVARHAAAVETRA